jgi:type IV secretory pathway VirB4 component
MLAYVLAAWTLVAIILALVVLAFRSLPHLPYNIRKTRAESEHGFDELIVPEYLIASQPHSVTFNEDGAFTTGFILTGPDATTKTQGGLARLVGDMNAVYSSTSVGWMYEFQRVRRPAPEPPQERFIPSPTHAVLNASRSQHAGTQCWVDDVVLLLTYLPAEGVSSTIASVLIRPAAGDLRRGGADATLQGLAALEDGCRSIEATLKTCMVDARRMHGVGDFDELVNTLYRNINGWNVPGVALPSLDDVDPTTGLLSSPVALRERLAVQDFDGGLALRYGREYIRLISIVEFPPKRRPRLLAELAQLAIPYRDHTRLIIGHPDAMLSHIQRRFNDAADEATPISMFGGQPTSATVQAARVNLDAQGRMLDLQRVIGEHRSGERQHAWYSRLIELRSENLDELERWERAIAETLRTAGFGVRTEDAHGVDAWLATHGGNGYNFVRRTAAHGVTVGDLTNVTDSWRGREVIKCDKCEPGTQPMAWVRRADTLAPFALDLHAGEGDVMSAIVTGPIRQGKTTLVNFLMGNFCKTARDRVVGIDYLRGEERTVVMLDGAYGTPGDAASGARLCPFTGLDTIEGRTRAVEWCELVARLNMPQHAVTGELLMRFSEAVDFLRASRNWRDEACVTLFLQKLSADRDVKATFRHYADGGIYGHIFDATPNEMQVWQRQIRVYDTTVLHELKERAVFPALAILFADTERQADGRRMLLIVEEAHIPLKHPLMEPWLIKLLRTKRKNHLGMIFVLTDLEGFSESTLRTLKTLCGTVFATQNPNANATRSAYHFLGFDDYMIDQLVPSRTTVLRRDGIAPLRYPYWQLGEDGIAPFVLDLSAEELEVFARGNDRDKERTAAALRDHESDAPAAIFEATQLPAASAAWHAYRDDHGAGSAIEFQAALSEVEERVPA